MDIKKLINGLHPLERSVLPVLSACETIKDIIKATSLKEVEVTRALQWLQNKKIIELDEEIEERVELDVNGKKYLQEGLPERKLLNLLREKQLALSVILNNSDLTKEELNICLGILKKKAAIFIAKEKELVIKLTDQGKIIMGKEMFGEQFLKKQFPVVLHDLKDEEKYAYDELKSRKKIIKTVLIKTNKAKLTELGKKILDHDIKLGNIIDKVTPEIIKAGTWKNKDFRRYDVVINVPKVYPGKRHFVNQVIEYTRKIWLDLGFKEMKGTIVQQCFWNFDALFTAQDHPVRDMQDSFYIKDPMYGKSIPKEILEKVKQTHESGWTTKSKGWQYLWNERDAQKNVIRTHTTVLSAHTLAQLKESELPAKFFAVGKCFRNETMDFSHLFEFNQTEGIVVDPNANFRHLLAYLRAFAQKMGYEKIRFRPAYFPYTEPSVEGDVYDPVHKKWVELIAAGMFRPEVVKPLLGKDIPVLAWGPGLDRMIVGAYGITDIRDLYKNDLKQLKDIKIWLK